MWKSPFLQLPPIHTPHPQTPHTHPHTHTPQTPHTPLREIASYRGMNVQIICNRGLSVFFTLLSYRGRNLTNYRQPYTYLTPTMGIYFYNSLYVILCSFRSIAPIYKPRTVLGVVCALVCVRICECVSTVDAKNLHPPHTNTPPKLLAYREKQKIKTKQNITNKQKKKLELETTRITL